MVDATFTLQLIGIVALGSFAGEFRRTTKVTDTPPDLSVARFAGSMLGSAFLSFWIAFAVYEYKGDRVASFLVGGILSYQEEDLVLRYGVGILRRLPAAWKALTNGDDE